jgi:acetyl-CoA synthetase
MKLGDAVPKRYDLSKLRLLGSVGEPINPEAWMWYHRVIGGARCPIVDTWWQTETGAIMMTPVPGVTPTKPGSCTRPLPGIFIDIVDEEGRAVKTPDGGGYLVIKRPWPSMLRTIWGDNPRYIQTYWEKFQNRFYVAGDSARRDKDGYYWIMGRIDDVLNIAGHRLGTMEIESALVAHQKVAEAAVVSKPHDIKGESAFAYVVLNVPRPEGAAAADLIEELRGWVADQLSPIAKPDEIRLTDNLPKTRSGKIMRRLLRAVARGEEITQDMSTLENPAILEQLRGASTPLPKQASKHRSAVQHGAAPQAPNSKGAERPVPMTRKSAARGKTSARRKARQTTAQRSGTAAGRKSPARPKTAPRTKRTAARKTAVKRKVPAKRKVAVRGVAKARRRSAPRRPVRATARKK